MTKEYLTWFTGKGYSTWFLLIGMFGGIIVAYYTNAGKALTAAYLALGGFIGIAAHIAASYIK